MARTMNPFLHKQTINQQQCLHVDNRRVAPRASALLVQRDGVFVCFVQVTALLMEAFLQRHYPDVRVVRVHSDTNIFRCEFMIF